jgi:hypothetical protein
MVRIIQKRLPLKRPGIGQCFASGGEGERRSRLDSGGIPIEPLIQRFDQLTSREGLRFENVAIRNEKFVLSLEGIQGIGDFADLDDLVGLAADFLRDEIL